MDVGRCPQCHGEGPPGEPCRSAGCRLRRYYYIPAAYGVDADLDDPMLGRVVADFLVVGVLGSGGFGNVHHVLQLPLRSRPVQGALKRLRPATNTSPSDHEALLQRFESEADALASLSHPNIVRLLKAGLDGEVPYLVLELVTDAETLEQEIDDHARAGALMSDGEIIAITEQILNALEAAHAQEIVHRDVKPGNVMLQRVAGYDIFVRVLDFGLAKFIGESSETQRVMGTLDYMAPEQLRGRDIGAWTDLYALGLVVLTMLTGRQAFSADRAVLVNEKLDPGYEPVRRALGDRDVAAERVAFLRRATAHDYHHRYTTVATFRRAFHDAFQPVARDRQRKLSRTRDLSIVPAAASAPSPAGPQLVSLPSPSAAPAPAEPRHVRRIGAPEGMPTEIIGPPLAPSVQQPPPASAPTRFEPSFDRPRPPVGPSSEAARWPLLAAIDRSRGKKAFIPPGLAPRTRAAPEPAPALSSSVTARHGDPPLAPRPVADTVDANDDSKKT